MRGSKGRWVPPACREPSLVSPRIFNFLEVMGDLDYVGWDGVERQKLWRYNQHYFDDLNAKNACERSDWHRALMLNWVKKNFPGIGCGWDPYPTSLRIINWIKWSLAGNKLPKECIQSLAVQARWLEKRLEKHLMGNHLFANAKALIFAGLFFEGEEAKRWLRCGLRISSREINEQILDDGSQFELSTMYQALVLEDLLDLFNIESCFLREMMKEGEEQVITLRSWIPKMVSWLRGMSHPDGEISFFNDSAIGVAPPVSELINYAKRLGFDVTSAHPFNQNPKANLNESFFKVLHLKNSGYIRVESDDAVTLLDVAKIGADYLPGHGHADTLSFELSLFGRRLLVNSGTSCYESGKDRLRQRGTAAHNTVIVNGKDSSEVWDSFRVARRAYPFGLMMEFVDRRCLKIQCTHDGYRRLKGNYLHKRKWLFGEQTLVIEDEVLGNPISAEARFHLHPQALTLINPGLSFGDIILEGERKIFWSVEEGIPRIELTSYHPRFGVSQKNQCIIINLKNGKSRLILDWR